MQLTRKQETYLLALLASVQFVHVLDFVIMMPLGPQLMRAFSISPTEFGFVVSAYTISAAISGFAGAFFIDHFDRKKSLVFLLMGFALGTLLCAVAPTYLLLLGARAMAGAFGGVLNAVVMSVMGEAIPQERRGAAMGLVMSAFSLASIVGVPFGLFVANQSDWHAPFFFLGFLAFAVVAWASRIMPSMREHIHGSNKVSLSEVKEVFLVPNHLRAFTFSVFVMFTAFTVIPYISAYMTKNVGLSEKDLPLIYLCGGLCTFFSSRLIGKLADIYGKKKMFIVMSCLCIGPILILTHLPEVPLWGALIITSVFMVTVSGRMVPGVTLITMCADPAHRGAFMSINGSIQQMAMGLASFMGGALLGGTALGRVENYHHAGYVGVGFAALSIFVATQFKVNEGKPGHPKT